MRLNLGFYQGSRLGPLSEFFIDLMPNIRLLCDLYRAFECPSDLMRPYLYLLSDREIGVGPIQSLGSVPAT